MKYSNRIIQDKYNHDENLKFLFFWGHQPNKDGSAGKGCFSQWWESDFEIDGIVYKSAEHFMMAEKARLFNDQESLKKIIDSKHPHDAKKLGRKVLNFNPKTWDEYKFDVVVKGNLAKFSQHDELKKFLIQTNDRILVEASPVDNIWGIGMAADNENVMNPNLWKGHNLLGYALMEVRDQLQ